MTEAINDTKNRTKKFDAGPAKNVRLGACPLGMIVAMNRMAIEVIVVKAAPSAMTTIAAGRRSSFRSPVAMMAQTRCRRPRRGISSREEVGRGSDIMHLSAQSVRHGRG